MYMHYTFVDSHGALLLRHHSCDRGTAELVVLPLAKHLPHGRADDEQHEGTNDAHDDDDGDVATTR
jgi:hypothetical protein